MLDLFAPVLVSLRGGAGAGAFLRSGGRGVDHMPLVVHLVHFQRSLLCSRGLHLVSTGQMSPSPLCAHGLDWRSCPNRKFFRITARPARAALRNFCAPALGGHRLRAYVGRTCQQLRTFASAAFVSAPTWAAPFPTSTPGREHRCSGTGWLRSEPTARLAWSPAPTPRLPTPRSPLRWHAD